MGEPARTPPTSGVDRDAVIAGYPAEAVQGSVRALWAAREASLAQAFAQAPHLIALGNLPAGRQAELFAARRREFRVR